MTHADYKSFQAWLRRAPTPPSLAYGAEYLAEVERNGICIVPDFWSAEKCADARAEIDRVITEYPRYVNGNAKADVRVYGANNASALIDDFAQDARLLAIASAYNHKATETAFTLAARMPTTPGNSGSGEGWHRDAFLRQFKAILYLSEVSMENGPFQFLSDSQRSKRVLVDMKTADLKYMQYRMEETQIARLLAQEPARLKTFTARAGTLILVDTSAIHRGKPIQAGTRYALTNYYFPTDSIDQSMYEKFDVLPRA
ncbi:hypothetical protein F506_01255 [Herbaspirillum hiltneri N3]|uniref:Phytanoyl-CoA dioxygenase PhyH n=1 Tax=Herbaspirillum hiltneri N3 TaxID=1262470 RepID=A0ABM5UWG6_9BURK|nr:hypothetical protein F506_01255 [Herbaspirillum hiltneri N3]